MTRLARIVTTRSGLRIGIAHVPQPRRELGSEAERVQSLLLAKPRRTDWPSVAFAVIVGLLAAGLLLHGMDALFIDSGSAP